MSSHDMSTYGEQRKAWAREWARLRREYLDGEAPARQNSHPRPGVTYTVQHETRHDSRTKSHADPHQ